MAQIAVAAQATSWALHRGRAVAVTRSMVQRRLSRAPIQAATPATKATKSGSSLLTTTEARRSHSGG